MSKAIEKEMIRQHIKTKGAIDRLSSYGFELLLKHFPEVVAKNYKKTANGYTRNRFIYNGTSRQLM